MQGEQVSLPTRRDRVGATLVIAEFDEDGFVVKLLDDRTNLPAGKLMIRKIRQQSNRIQ